MNYVPAKWPSSTQVLHDAGLYGDIAKWSDSEAMRRGRLVDAACNLLAMGKELTDEWCFEHPECGPYVDGYYEFLKRHQVKLVKCAFEVVNRPLRYTGHPDQLVLLDDVLVLIDIKTGGMPKCTPLQLASYEMALYSMNDPDVADSRIVRCGLQLAAGDFKLHWFTDPREKDEWSILVQAWHVRAKYIEVSE
jgi:hypothetical protein